MIYKVQMPLKSGSLVATIDESMRPKMLIYRERREDIRVISNDELWHFMSNVDNGPGNPKGWIKAFWNTKIEDGKLVFIEPVPLQNW